MKLCGCVVLYNPDEDVLQNIDSYISQLEILYVLDNSENKNDKVVESLQHNKKCRYLDMKGNKGIACALNRALKRANRNRYEWLLTMDQDSSFSAESLSVMKHYIEKNADPKVAIVCARYLSYSDRRRTHSSEISYVKSAITSGSVVNVRTALKLGGYLNDLFIDEVDNEYCYRLIINGYKIVKLNNVLFKHSVGKQKIVKGCKTFNYAPFRYYYIIRNECYVIKKYKKYSILADECEDKKNSIFRWIKRVFYEEDKLRKYGYMLLGLFHFCIGRMGVLKIQNRI